MLPEVELQYTWGGALCLSANNGVLFGKREKGIYQAIGCNGLGLSRGSTSGKLIAEFALGQDSSLLRQVQPFRCRALAAAPIDGHCRFQRHLGQGKGRRHRTLTHQ
jgi:glycine/D-amino acid oxidase-like deaminating enzyme